MGINLNDHFFTAKQVLKGCRLAAISHAIMVGHYPELSHEHSWDGNNYSVQDSQGCRGTVSFSESFCIAAFRLDSIAIVNYSDSVKDCFLDAPNDAVNFANEECLLYLLEEHAGTSFPVITTGFWATEKGLWASHSNDLFLERGGFIMSRQLSRIEDSIASWAEYYDMNSIQVELLSTLFQRDEIGKEPRISASEFKRIGSITSEGEEECISSFAELGFVLE